MKYTVYISKKIIFLATLLLVVLSCKEDRYNGIENSGEVKICSFVTEAIHTVFSEEKGSIELIFPSSFDLTQVTASITLSDRASIIMPERPEGPIDLSKPRTYRVVNGNIYHDYQVVGVHVKDKVRINSFMIGKYKGVIDHNARTIAVAYPKGEPVTSLSPVLTITEGAILVAPLESQIDFTDPVAYRISYLGEEFTYMVSVVSTDLTPIGFLGDAASAAEITNADEKAAWMWLSENFVDPVYISFSTIKKGADLSKYGVLWYHCDPDKFEIPGIATDPVVIAKLKSFRESGGGLFLSSAGVRLGTGLGIAKNDAMWNNDWGYGNAPSILSENWGIRFAGNEEHPVFRGLRMETGENNRFYIVGKGVKVKGHNALWNFDSWTGYNFDVSKWEEENGGKQLASFYWDDEMNQRSVITEYERKGNLGATITIAVESYDWYHEDNSPVNIYRDNLEILTANILGYLAK